MNKKELLSTLIALLIVTGVIRGAANYNKIKTIISNKTEIKELQKRQRYTELNPKTVLYEDYQITIIDTIIIKQEETYKSIIPIGFNFMPESENLAFKVEKIDQTIYDAVPIPEENGTMTYYLPFGGELIGTKGIITSYKKVSEEESYEVIINYLSEAKLNLKA